MSDYLQLMARVAALSSRRWPGAPPEACPTLRSRRAATTACRRCRRNRTSARHNGAPIWQTSSAMSERSRPTAYWSPSRRSMRSTKSAQEALADRVLAGTSLDAEAALVPFVGAALQTYFTRLAATLDVALGRALRHRRDLPGVRIATGGQRAANRRRAGEPALPGVFALCDRMERGTHSMYLVRHRQRRQVSGAAGRRRRLKTDAAARAETCDECKSYLKIFYQEKDPNLDPTADDLATLALDLLVDEQGYARSGPNLLFHPGST